MSVPLNNVVSVRLLPLGTDALKASFVDDKCKSESKSHEHNEHEIRKKIKAGIT